MGNALWTPPAVGIDACARLPGKGMTAAWVRGKVISSRLQDNMHLEIGSKLLFLQNAGEKDF